MATEQRAFPTAPLGASALPSASCYQCYHVVAFSAGGWDPWIDEDASFLGRGCCSAEVGNEEALLGHSP